MYWVFFVATGNKGLRRSWKFRGQNLNFCGVSAGLNFGLMRGRGGDGFKSAGAGGDGFGICGVGVGMDLKPAGAGGDGFKNLSPCRTLFWCILLL